MAVPALGAGLRDFLELTMIEQRKNAHLKARPAEYVRDSQPSCELATFRLRQLRSYVASHREGRPASLVSATNRHCCLCSFPLQLGPRLFVAVALTQDVAMDMIRYWKIAGMLVDCV